MTANDAIKKDDDGAYVFSCRECGAHVLHFGDKPAAPVCCTCEWTAGIADETERECVRRLLGPGP